MNTISTSAPDSTPAPTLTKEQEICLSPKKWWHEQNGLVLGGQYSLRKIKGNNTSQNNDTYEIVRFYTEIGHETLVFYRKIGDHENIIAMRKVSEFSTNFQRLLTKKNPRIPEIPEIPKFTKSIQSAIATILSETLKSNSNNSSPSDLDPIGDGYYPARRA